MTEKIGFPDLQDFTILIAEDDIFSFQMMEYMLQGTKATIIHADTGLKAIKIMDSKKIDFVFLDIRLPDKDGYHVLKHIRQSNSQIPVIAQTANSFPEEKRKTKKAGFNSHIIKPFSQDDLYQVLNEYVPRCSSLSFEKE